MRNRGKRPEETKILCHSLPAFLSFFQSGALPSSQQNLAIELVPETQEGHGVGRDNINSDNDCACE